MDQVALIGTLFLSIKVVLGFFCLFLIFLVFKRGVALLNATYEEAPTALEFVEKMAWPVIRCAVFIFIFSQFVQHEATFMRPKTQMPTQYQGTAERYQEQEARRVEVIEPAESTQDRSEDREAIDAIRQSFEDQDDD